MRGESCSQEAGLGASVRYTGPAVAAGQTVYWQVRIWDEHDVASGWSTTALWQHGIPANAWDDAAWIAFPSPKDEGQLSAPAAQLTHAFKTNGAVSSATLYVSALGVYEVRINGTVVGDRILTPGWSDYP